MGRRLGVSGRHHQLALGEPVRRRRLLDRSPIRPIPNAVYAEAQGGYIGRVDRTHARRRATSSRRPATRRSCASTGTRRSRVSPTQKGTIYIGAQFLFRSRDHGDTWERISPDLTTNDPEKQKQEQSGGVTVDNSSAEMHTTIYSISESPKDANVIWVGTDDGNVQLTRDGGKTLDERRRQRAGPAGELVGELGRGRAASTPATAYVDVRSPHVRRHDAVGLHDHRLRQDAGSASSRPSQGVRGYAHVIKRGPGQAATCCSSAPSSACGSRSTAARRWAQFKGGDFPAVAVRDLAGPAARQRSRASRRTAAASGSSTTSRRCARSTRDDAREAGRVPAGAAGAAAHAARTAAGPRATRRSSATNPPTAR